jgi:glucose/arabinose dehydrogenase
VRILGRVVATLGLVAVVTVSLVWWTDRSDHSEGDAEVLATGLEVPWGLTFLPTGEALVGERNTGRIYRIPADGGERTLVGTVPGVVPDGEGGLLGLAVDPLFIHDSFVYAYLTAEADNRIIRFRLAPGEPEVYDVELVLDGIAKAGNHDGGALAFGPDGMLYAGVGDAGDPSRAQDPTSLNGKILRMDPLGNAPTEDPNPDPASLVWSMGHRNVQGLGWAPDGRMFASEFGQNTWDELNQIEPGANYGWPVAEGIVQDEAFLDPLRQWSTADASPSGLAVTDEGVYLAGLRGERLWRAPLRADGVGKPQALLTDLGRLRAVVQAPDGSLWVMTNNTDGRGSPRDGDDRIVRITVG